MSNDTVVIIGWRGPAGSKPLAMWPSGARVVLVEWTAKLGGTPIRENYAALTPNFESAEVAMQRMIDRSSPARSSTFATTATSLRARATRARSASRSHRPMVSRSSMPAP